MIRFTGSIRSRISRSARPSVESRFVRSLPDSRSRLSFHSPSSRCSPLVSRSSRIRSKSFSDASGSARRFGFGQASRKDSIVRRTAARWSASVVCADARSSSRTRDADSSDASRRASRAAGSPVSPSVTVNRERSQASCSPVSSRPASAASSSATSASSISSATASHRSMRCWCSPLARPVFSCRPWIFTFSPAIWFCIAAISGLPSEIPSTASSQRVTSSVTVATSISSQVRSTIRR